MADGTRAIDLEFPLAGLHRGAALQRQPPFTSPDLQNVRPRDTFDRRERGGSRPGLTRVFHDQLFVWSYLAGNHDGQTTITTADLIFAPYMIGYTFWNLTVGSGWESHTILEILQPDKAVITPAISTGGSQCYVTPATIQCLTSLFYGKADGRTVVQDDFSAGLSGRWTVPAGVGDTLPTVVNGVATAPDGTTVTAIYEPVPLDIPYGSNKPGFMAEMLIIPDSGNYSGTYRILAYLDDTTPDSDADSFIAEITINGTDGTLTGRFLRYVSSVETEQTFSYQFPAGMLVDAGWLQLEHIPSSSDVTKANRVRINFRGVNLYESTAAYDAPQQTGGTRFGFQMVNSESGTTAKCGAFLAQFATGPTTGAKKLSWREPVISIAQGRCYVEDEVGDMISVSDYIAPPQCSLDKFLQAMPFYQKTYVLDHGGPSISEEKDATRVTVTWNATVAGIGKLVWAPEGYGGNYSWADSFYDNQSEKPCGVQIYDSASGGFDGTFRILNVSGTSLYFIHDPTFNGGSSTGGLSAKFYIDRMPKQIIYSDDEDAVELFDWGITVRADTSTPCPRYLPLGCRLGEKYGERIVIAGDPRQPFAYYMCRVGDPDNWDYGQTDAEAAVAGSLLGLYGKEISSLAAFSDDYLIMGCLTALWIMRGDPAAGGELQNLSRTVGIVGPEARCWLPEGDLIFLAADGLYRLPPGGNVYPIPLSRDRVPDELLNLNWRQERIMLVYDQVQHGVYITTTPATLRAAASTDASATSWWFDPVAGSFWKDTSVAQAERVAALQHGGYIPGSLRGGLLFGTRAASVEKLGVEYVHDSILTAVSTHVKYGPFRLGSHNLIAGFLTEIQAALGEDSDDVTWELFLGDSPEGAEQSTTAVESGTLSAGANYTQLARRRAHSAVLKLSTTGGARWAIESISALLRDAGRHKLT